MQPIERNISYRQLRASEIAEHWTQTVATTRQDRRPPTQTALDLDAAMSARDASTTSTRREHANALELAIGARRPATGRP